MTDENGWKHVAIFTKIKPKTPIRRAALVADPAVITLAHAGIQLFFPVSKILLVGRVTCSQSKASHMLAAIFRHMIELHSIFQNYSTDSQLPLIWHIHRRAPALASTIKILLTPVEQVFLVKKRFFVAA